MRTYFVYFESEDIDTFLSLLRLSSEIEIQEISSSFLRIVDKFDSFDIEAIRNVALEEIYQDFTALELPMGLDIEESFLMQELPLLENGIYNLALMIKQSSKKQRTSVKTYFKQLFLTTFGREMMDTILGFIEYDLNASKASKGLFMHRNTLAYRIDHFISKSGIDVRSFEGAFSIYLLFL